MRKLLIMAFVTVFAISIQAQSIREEIRQNIRCSASNHMAYPGPVQHRLTPAPEGKKAFYISHYGHCGSCYLTTPESYDVPYRVLAAADKQGKLTTLGVDVFHRVKLIRDDARQHWGELTSLGARQHQQIMRRMVDRFPEIFVEGTTIDARSTIEMRCIMSMENAMMQLMRMCPNVKVHHNATRRDMYYLDQQDAYLDSLKKDGLGLGSYEALCKENEDSRRLMRALFNDTAYIHRHVDVRELNFALFELASNIQNTDMRNTLTLYDLFTDNELYHNWRQVCAKRYITYGFTPLSGAIQPYSQRNLLHRIIEQADSCIRQERPNVHLRYGLENVLLPLVCLLDINNYGYSTIDLESLERHGWADYRICPMAANVQFIFYRQDPQDDDVLVKVLLNENEAMLPVRSAIEPYYHWSDVRDYYLKKLKAYEKR